MSENPSMPEGINLDDPQNYLNRELGLLEFQRRVLEEAADEGNPLLERIKFLSILSSNLDEFFMIRVGGLKMQNNSGMVELSIDGKTPAQQLAAIRKTSLTLMEEGRKVFNKTLLPQLKRTGIQVLEYGKLRARQKESVNAYFNEVVFPVLTPLAFNPGHPFPHISNLSLNLAILIQDEEGHRQFARLKVPSSLPMLVPIKRSSGSIRRDGTVPYNHYFVWLVQVIIENLNKLFPGMKVIEAHPFHVTRNADFEIQELEASDLLETIEENVRKRRFGDVVRLLLHKNMPTYIKDILIHNLKMDKNDVYELDAPLDLRSVMQLAKIDRYDLKDKPFVPFTPGALKRTTEILDSSIFTAIRSKNIMLRHPYDSFLPVIDFLRAAARDPDVLAIKQTLYRVGGNSPIVQALLEARRDYGKQVAVLVELKARFDEESNIEWARILEQEGVHVTYGLLGLKTHSKIALVVRKEGEHIHRYVHLGTGNYNHITAQIYEDIGMFTCDPDIGADTSDLFNYLTGYSSKENYRKLVVAPLNMREHFEHRIREEMAHQAKGETGHIIFKMNALVDKPMIRLLYEASQAGVKIDLIVRGTCCLRPAQKGLSDNIRVTSILGRFLEHSRIFYFRNGGNEKILMGSADLMSRNLNRRVEVLFPIEDAAMVRHVRDDILEGYLRENFKARLMQPDGSYIHLRPAEGEPVRSVQRQSILNTSLSSTLAED